MSTDSQECFKGETVALLFTTQSIGRTKWLATAERFDPVGPIPSDVIRGYVTLALRCPTGFSNLDEGTNFLAFARDLLSKFQA